MGYVQLGHTIRTTVGGNSELQPEDADTFTVGLVWEPTFTSGLSFTLDYWEIEIEDSIQRIPGSEKLAICYSTGDLNHPFCAPEHHTHDPLTGELNFLSAQPSNVGSETASGVDLGVVYVGSLAGLDTDVSWNVSYLDDYTVTPFKGAAPIEYAGMITGDNGSYTHLRSDVSATIGAQRWSGTWGIQYIGDADDINTSEGPGSHVSGVFYHNVQFKYAVTDAIDVAVGIDNVLDKEAPYVAMLDGREHRHDDLRSARAALVPARELESAVRRSGAAGLSAAPHPGPSWRRPRCYPCCAARWSVRRRHALPPPFSGGEGAESS